MALKKVSIKKASSAIKQLKTDFMKKHKDGNPEVIEWIADFLYQGISANEASSCAAYLCRAFKKEYDKQFAVMLMNEFDRGVITIKYDSVVWEDSDGKAYMVTGLVE